MPFGFAPFWKTQYLASRLSVADTERSEPRDGEEKLLHWNLLAVWGRYLVA